MTDKTPVASRKASSSGLVVGRLGGDDDQLLEDGQEEVFSRAEVEAGRIEHAVEAGGDREADPRGPLDPQAGPPALNHPG